MPHEHEYDPTLQSPTERRSLLSQGILRLRRLFVQVANITTLRTDTITERTPAAGVTIDRLLIKDIVVVPYAADAEASDTYVITLTSAPLAYVAGQVFAFKANTTNTGAATLNVNSLGAKTIKKEHDVDLANGDIEAGQIVTVVYDGTQFQMQSLLGNAPAAGGQDLATDTLWAAQGDLVKGTGDDGADILTIGADHTILVSNGSVPSWSAAPPLANIADTGDTNRITISSSNPNVLVTATLRVGTGTTDGHLSIGQVIDTGSTLLIANAPSLTGSTYEQILISGTAAFSSGTSTIIGVSGIAKAAPVNGISAGTVKGLDFGAEINTGSMSDGESATLASVIAAVVRPTLTNICIDETITLNITEAVGLDVATKIQYREITIGGSPDAAGTITTLYGIRVQAPNFTNETDNLQDYYGTKIEDEANATGFIRLLEVGPATPYFRVLGNFTAAANETPVYVSEGATPTLRQLKTVVETSLDTGAGTKLICYLS